MSASDITAAEYRALGRLMRHARAEGYTYHRTTAFGRTDYRWQKSLGREVTAERYVSGWQVVTYKNGEVWPESVRELADVLVGFGYLPAEFHSISAEVVKLREKLDMPCGHCHPCTNWAPQTWINAGRSIPPVHRYDAMVAELELRRAKAGAA